MIGNICVFSASMKREKVRTFPLNPLAVSSNFPKIIEAPKLMYI